MSLLSASERLDYQILENVFLSPKPGAKVRLDSTIGWPVKIVMHCIVARSFAQFEMIAEFSLALVAYFNATDV